MPTVIPPQSVEASTSSSPAHLSLISRPAAVLRHPSGIGSRAWIAISTLADAAMLAIAAVLSSGPFLALLMMSVVCMAELGRRKLYTPHAIGAGLLPTTGAALCAVAVGAIVTLAATAVFHHSAATDGVLRAWLFASVTVTLSRLTLALWRRNAHARGLVGRRTLIIGAGAIGAQLEHRMRDNPAFGMIPVGYLDADPADADRGIPVLGSPDMLEQIVADTHIDFVVVAFSSAPDSEVLPLLRRCERLGLELAVVPRLYENVNRRQRVEHVGGLPLLAMRTPHPHSWEYAVKHTLDRLVAAILVVVASPLLIGLAIAVKITSPGPVLFRQPRVGRDGRAFDILKFRSMRVASAETDELLRQRLRASGSAPGGVEGLDRRTPIGTFLRRFSLDELPQLLNVLRGDMSLVGPRPERPEFVDLFQTDLVRYDDRHRVKSGMTGWAQVSGLRGQTSLADRVECDNWYIQNWSVWLDLKILILTPLEIIRSQAESSNRSPTSSQEA
ncbi:MAG TPA: sugar transferase [Baekduia sp.]|nr:sugar transferase [Baekduia sp.]